MQEENTQPIDGAAQEPGIEAISGPLVSVIVPAWNAAGSIGPALDSLRRQTYKNLQVVVCNDGSEDETGRIVQENYPEVIYVEQENSGPSSARNTAAQSATGDLLAFLDTDDEWPAHYAEQMVAMFDEHPGAGLVGCNALVRAGENKYPFCQPPGSEVRELSVLQLMRGIRPPGPAVVIRADAFREMGGFDTSIIDGEDLDLLCRLVASGHRLVYTTEALYLKTEHPGNLSARSYSLRAADHLRGFVKMDPRRDDFPWDSPLTGRQYSALVSQDIVRGAIACWRERKREIGQRYLNEIGRLPAPSVAARVTAGLGRSMWPLFGLLASPYYLWGRLMRGIDIWGVRGFARQIRRRYLGSGRTTCE